MSELRPQGASPLPARRSGARYLHLTWLPAVWLMQYAGVIPCLWFTYLLGDLIRISTKLGVAGLICLCIPIVGWVVLAIMAGNALSGNGRKRHRPYPLHPWGAHLLEA